MIYYHSSQLDPIIAEGAMELNESAPLVLCYERKNKKRKKELRAGLDEPLGPSHDHSPANLPAADAQSEILASEFDYSVENHFKFADTLAEICGYPETLDVDQAEIKRFADSITFLREWRDFNYEPRNIKFAYQRNSEEKDVIGGITLSQFSSASVPKKLNQNDSGIGAGYCNDHVMNVGGAVWALDWCPRIDENSYNCIKSEFVAVAAHPPDSSYHNIGSPLTGRGAIQIWCLLTDVNNERCQGNKKSQPKKFQQNIKSNELTKVSRPRGRPRKRVLNDTLEKIDPDNEHQQLLAIECPMNSPEFNSLGKPSENKLTQMPRPRGRPRKKARPDSLEKIDPNNVDSQPLAIEYPMDLPQFNSSDRPSVNDSNHVYGEECIKMDEASNCMAHAKTLLFTAPGGRANKPKAGKAEQSHDNGLSILGQCDRGESAPGRQLKSTDITINSLSPDKSFCTDAVSTKNSIPTDVALPRMMMCLAHNGKVAWDIKWQPVDSYRPVSNYMMGYLAVLLGNGALEVWEVPLPNTVKLVYPASQERIDPRFIKLRPVFRCSMLKCGDRRSIPLTVEWSVSSPHDMILAGCHDGVVALWKFSVSGSLTESRPLLSFSADTCPIRSLSWAPNPSNLESGGNIIVTAGYKCVKFWDIRDPFRPLWEHPIQVATYGLDWLQDPRCVFGLTEDGTIWLLSLEKAAHDLPVNGKYHMSSKLGFHNFDCSAFSLWCLQASRPSGMVAYCGEEGSTLCFQPTSRSLKDPSRNRVHHYLCGSLMEDENAIIVATPLPNSSFQTRSPGMKRSAVGKELEKKTKEQIGGSDDVEKLDSRTRRVERAEEFEVFPPKIVAMHRVRWNVNKGREKWLCYGGAAGLVRCQELSSSGFQ